jgi:hypothetical protein
MSRNLYHRIIALWRGSCEHTRRPCRTGKWLKVLIEDGNLVKVCARVPRVVVTADDVVGFKDSTERPIEYLSVAGSMGKRSAVTR